MFKRRKPREISALLREMVWPSMGWKRALSYFHHRLFRQSDSAYRITGGLATGAAVSFTPLLGTHFVQSFIYAHIFRQSKIAALVGTFWGNPWTLPPIFYFDYHLGVWMMKVFQASDFVPMPQEHTLSHFLSDPLRLFLPLMIGGTILALLSWPVAYLMLYYPVRGMQRAYRLQRLLRLRKKRSGVPT